MRVLGSFFVLVAALLAFAGCSGGGGSDGAGGGASGANEHVAVTLRDSLGVPIPLGSSTPYSPRKTCGSCHDVDAISNGYHFQQGRTDENGQVICADDYFGDGRTFLRSSGMYGKW